MKDQRKFVDVLRIGGVDHVLCLDVTLVRDLSLQLVTDRLIASTHDDVGLDAARTKLRDAVLSRFGLLFPARSDERHQRHMDVANIVAADFVLELTNRLEERKDLDVTNGSTDLGDDDVHIVGGQALNTALDLIGDVRDDLNGPTQVITTSFRGKHRLIDAPCRCVRRTREVLVDEAFVVAEVEVRLATVIGDEDLSMFERIHGARIDVDVRIELLHRDAQTAHLQESAEGGSCESFAERACHSASHEHMLWHPLLPS